MPFLFGLRRHLTPPLGLTAIQPYYAFGAGPYLAISISEWEEEDREEATMRSHIGAFAGGGVQFLLGSWIGVNLDVRYHAFDLKLDHEFSDWEYGLGLTLMWGE